MTVKKYLKKHHHNWYNVLNKNFTNDRINQLYKIIEHWHENELRRLNDNTFCEICYDGSGWYGNDDLMYNCSRCNPEAI